MKFNKRKTSLYSLSSCNVNGEPAVNEANCYIAPFNISLKEIFKMLIG